jgi:leucyl/phenylalanyl-tRNA---protein transferase
LHHISAKASNLAHEHQTESSKNSNGFFVSHQHKQEKFDRHGFPRHLPDDDVVAVGGPMTPARLEAAYRRGIFPWPHEGYPLLWFSPDPRYVIPLESFHSPDSLKRVYRQNRFQYTVNRCFRAVIENCRNAPRPGQDGTWITDQIVEAYTALHLAGIVHSVETWQDGQLVGGLYGVLSGKVFAGESMFAKTSNASKCAMLHLAEWLRTQHAEIIDCQMETPLMQQFGGRFISRSTFLEHLPA